MLGITPSSPAQVDAGLAAAQGLPLGEALRNVRARMRSLFGDIPLALVDAAVSMAYARHAPDEPDTEGPVASVRDSRMQSIGREVVAVVNRHARTTAVATSDLFDGNGEGRVHGVDRSLAESVAAGSHGSGAGVLGRQPTGRCTLHT